MFVTIVRLAGRGFLGREYRKPTGKGEATESEVQAEGLIVLNRCEQMWTDARHMNVSAWKTTETVKRFILIGQNLLEIRCFVDEDKCRERKQT
jgi:hypothetical protein